MGHGEVARHLAASWWRWRLPAALLSTACLIVPIGAALEQRATNRTEQPLTQQQPGWSEEAVPVRGEAYIGIDGWTSVHRIRLVTSDVGRLVGHRQISLLVATHDTYPILERAELALAGTACVYRTAEGIQFPNNALLTFDQGDKCLPLRGQPDGRVILTIRLRNQAKLAIWTFNAGTAASPQGVLLIDRPDPTTRARLVRGNLVDAFEAGSTSRVTLLAYVWQVANGPGWIWAAVALSAGLMFVGTLAFWGEKPKGRSRSSEAILRGTAMFCLSASMGLLYAAITPPFQAADEPNHFVGFGVAIARPSLANDATRMASLGHFERIQFHPEERFRTSDVGRPGVPWDDGVEPDAAFRGSGVRFLWQAVAPLVGSLPAPRLLLALRLINVLLFALTAGAAAAVLVLFTDVRQPHLLLFPLIVVPAIPFFGMHVSNHASLLCAYLVMATGVLLLVLDAPAPAATGLAIGAGWGMGLAISRSASPLAPFIGLLLFARLMLGGVDLGFRSVARFWACLTTPLFLMLLVTDRAYLDTMTRLGGQVLSAPLAVTVRAISDHPWLLPLAGIAAAALEIVIGRGRVWLAPWRPAARRAIAWGTPAAAVTVASVALASLFVSYPTLPPVDAIRRPLPAQYAERAVSAGLTLLRLRNPDRLTSTTFWTGFGWLETIPPSVVASSIAGLTAVLLMALLIRSGRAHQVRRSLWIVSAVLGYVVSLAAYALTVLLTTPADLHGRYLLGLYLSMLLICWIPLSEWRTTWTSAGLAAARLVGCTLFSALVNGYCLRFIAERYF
jgi:hypothetical protein